MALPFQERYTVDMKIPHLFLAAFLVSFGVVIFGEAGLVSAYKMSQEKARLESRIQRLTTENEQLQAKIDAIQKDPIALEHEIRRTLSLVSADEILIKFQ